MNKKYNFPLVALAGKRLQINTIRDQGRSQGDQWMHQGNYKKNKPGGKGPLRKKNFLNLKSSGAIKLEGGGRVRHGHGKKEFRGFPIQIILFQLIQGLRRNSYSNPLFWFIKESSYNKICNEFLFFQTISRVLA